jgi:hypothetical protein
MPKKLFTEAFINKWKGKYEDKESDQDEYLHICDQVKQEINSIGTISSGTMRRIAKWKSSRASIHFKWDVLGIYQSLIKEILAGAHKNPIEALASLPGIKGPMGSTILHFLSPDVYPIYDVRTVKILYEQRLIKRKTATVLGYKDFCSAIYFIREDLKEFSLRDIDCAIFAYEKYRNKQNKRNLREGQPCGGHRSGKKTIPEMVQEICNDLGKDGKIIERPAVLEETDRRGIKPGSVLLADWCCNTRTGRHSKHDFLYQVEPGRYVLARYKYQSNHPVDLNDFPEDDNLKSALERATSHRKVFQGLSQNIFPLLQVGVRTAQIQNELSKIRVPTPPFLSNLIVQTNNFGLIRKLTQHESVQILCKLGAMMQPIAGQILNIHSAVKSLSTLAGSNQNWAAAIQSAKAIHPSWLKAIDSLNKLGSIQVEIMAKERLIDASKYSSLATEIVQTADFDSLKKKSTFTGVGIQNLKGNFQNFGQSYDQLVASIKTPEDLLSLPEHTVPGAGRELFLAGCAVQSIVLEPDEKDEAVAAEGLYLEHEEEDRCIVLLEDIHPPLAEMYRGAEAAIISGHTDHARHSITSMRELCTKLIQRLAPSNAVKAWNTDPNLLHEGRPTRRARLEYIFRDVKHGGLTDFVDESIRFSLALFDAFNRLHSDEPDLSKVQLNILLLKVRHLIEFILGFRSQD